jgi:hypothetical protein
MEQRMPNPRSLPDALRTIGARLVFADGILLLPLAALLASMIRWLGVSCGHDFDFHTISWLEVENSWKQGLLYPHWAQIPNWTAGEPRFVFYPPVTWIVGALLGYLIAWTWVPAVFTFLCFLASGLGTRAFARQFLPGPRATLAGVIAAITPYGLFTAYERTAFAELAATSMIPLLLLFAWRAPGIVGAGSRFRVPPTVALALTLTAIWLTNAPAGVMASYLLAFAALAAAGIERRWWPVLRASLAAPLGIGLAGFYLLPALREQSWIDITQAVDVGMRVEDSWMFAHHASADMEFHDAVLRHASNVFVFTVSLAAIAFLVAWLRGKLPETGRRYWMPLAILIPALLMLQFSFSQPLWHLLPKLPFLQFPWRWLMVLGLPYSIFLAAATPLESFRSRIVSPLVWALVLSAIVWFCGPRFYQECGDEDVVDNQTAIGTAGAGVMGTDEYQSAGSDNALIATGLPDACLVSDPKQVLGDTAVGMAPVWYSEQGSCDDTFTADVWKNEFKALDVEADHDGYIVMRLSRYPAWQITENGKPMLSQGNRDDGLMVLPVPQGDTHVEIRWVTGIHNIKAVTPDVFWGRIVSALSLVGLMLAWIASGWMQRAKKREA